MTLIGCRCKDSDVKAEHYSLPEAFRRFMFSDVLIKAIVSRFYGIACVEKSTLYDSFREKVSRKESL